MPVKDIQLNLLKDEIARVIPDYWLFPTDERTKVQGFMGTGGKDRIMIVGERPSSKEHGKDSWKDFFYEILKENNLVEAHLTDLVKSRGKGGDLYPNNVHEDWRIFKREIAIVNPTKILALSAKVHDYIFFHSVEKKIKLFKIDHYSYALRYNKVEKFKEQIRKSLID